MDQPIDQDARIDSARCREFSLRDEFSIGWCDSDDAVAADYRCTDSVWTSTDLAPDQARLKGYEAWARRRSDRMPKAQQDT